MTHLRNLLAAAAIVLCPMASLAADTESGEPSFAPPVIHRLIFPDNSIGVNMSDNGKWLVANIYTSLEVNMTKGHLYNIDADTYEDLPAVGGTNDVTDDGNLIVGSHNDRPAYWTRSDNKWHTIPVPAGWDNGRFYAVTPDGHYAVGSFSDASLFYERGVMWDLFANKEVVLTNLPKLDMQHVDDGEMRYSAISADGRYVIVSMDFAYLEPAELCSFVYDVQTQTYQTIGFIPSDTKPWTPLVPGIHFIDAPVMSPSGEWVTGIAYMLFEDGSDNPRQYYASFRMNVHSGDFEVYSEDEGYTAYAVCDDGTVLGSSPTTSPLRDWAVRYGKHWVPARLISEQRYGEDFSAITHYERTGTAIAVSSDGRRVLTLIDPTSESAVIDYPEPLRDVSAGINLLAPLGASPAADSEFPRLTSISLAFNQRIQLVGAADNIQFIDSKGNVKRSANEVSMSQNPMVAEITFRGTNLTAGENYELVIPAGTFSMASDQEMLNREIRIPYRGRANEAVKLISIYPENGSSIIKIDNTESPLQLTFDTNVSVTSATTARPSLILVEETGESVLCPLSMSASGPVLYLYPAATQYAYDGASYRIDVPAGCVTDVAGYGANEAFSFSYTGAYIREISHDDESLFKTDFSNMATSLATFLLYEGDHNVPSADMASVGFDADNTPWNFSLREDAYSTDLFAASHSDYTSPSRKSDDWMMIPMLYLPDAYCQVEFDAQRYKSVANDRLRVAVWATDDIINTLTPAIMERVKAEAVTVFDEVIPAGATDEGTTGEWTHYIVNLPQFAGKNVYIAFVNDNEGQSAIFLDNLLVKRSLKYFLSLNVDDAVVARTSQRISGTLVANAEGEVITDVEFALFDADGQQLDRLTATGLSLHSGDALPFIFYETLPLTIGKEVPYSVEVTVNGIYHEVINASIRDLAFSPTKRVVVEEMTGFDCGNCPLGILAIEELERLYGSQFIPISIHTYTGDPYGAGLMDYTSYLNIFAAPTAQVNRSGDVISPMWQNPATGQFQFTNEETHDTWLDYVQEEFRHLAEADIDLTVTIDEAAGTMTIPVNVTYALDAENLHLNLLAVVLEDEIMGYQTNYFAAYSDPLLGAWAGNGIYAQSRILPYFHNDVARAVIGTSYAGTAGLLPQTMTAGETVTATIQAPLPLDLNRRTGEYSSYDYARIAVLLINADNGRVINAAVAPMTDHNYREAVHTPTITDAPSTPIYDLLGRRVTPSTRTPHIQNGRLILP